MQGQNDDDVFIATQGPKRNTVIDFWNMVLEQKTSIIVCLTNIMEIGNVRQNICSKIEKGRAF